MTQRDAGGLLSESTVLIDNVFVSIGLQLGIVGVALWALMMWSLWLYLLRRATMRGDALAHAIAAVWATWPVSLMFGSGTEFYLLLAILMVLTERPATRAAMLSAAMPPMNRRHSFGRSDHIAAQEGVTAGGRIGPRDRGQSTT